MVVRVLRLCGAGFVAPLHQAKDSRTTQAVGRGSRGEWHELPTEIHYIYCYGHYSTSKRTVAGSIPDSSIFRKRFKNSWHNDLLTLAATRCVMPSTVAKKIFRADHHARRRIKNKIPGAFVASVINYVKGERQARRERI